VKLGIQKQLPPWPCPVVVIPLECFQLTVGNDGVSGINAAVMASQSTVGVEILHYEVVQFAVNELRLVPDTQKHSRNDQTLTQTQIQLTQVTVLQLLSTISKLYYLRRRTV